MMLIYQSLLGALALASLAQGYSLTSCTIDASYSSVSVSAGSSVQVQMIVPTGKYYQVTSFNFGSQTSDSIAANDLLYTNGQVSGTGPLCESIAPDNYFVYAGTTAIYSLACNNYFYSCTIWYRASYNTFTITPAPSTGSTSSPTAPSPSPTKTPTLPPTTTIGATSSPTPAPTTAIQQFQFKNTFQRYSSSCSNYIPTACETKCSSSYVVFASTDGLTTSAWPTYSGSDCTCYVINFDGGSNAVYGTISFPDSSHATIVNSACTLRYATTTTVLKGTYQRSSYSCTGYIPTACDLKCTSSYDVYQSSGSTFAQSNYAGSDCACVPLVNGSLSSVSVTFSGASSASVDVGPCIMNYEATSTGYDGLALAISLGSIVPGVGLGLIAPAVDLLIQGNRGRSHKTLALIYIGNFFWLALGAWLFFFMYIFTALVLALTIVLIPFSIKILHLSVLVLLPFGRRLEDDLLDSKQQQVSCIANVVWIVIGGVLICVLHLIMAIMYMLSIIGIPIGMKHLELAKNGLLPFGKTVKISDKEINVCGGDNTTRRTQEVDTVQATQIRSTSA